MPTKEFLHKRNFSNIQSRYLLEWEGEPLKGVYILEHTLISKPVASGFSVLLAPGIFDPVKGEYGAETIEGLLKSENISAVYEIHFLFNDTFGLLNMDSVISDLLMLFTKGSQPVLAIGLSGGTMMIYAALYEIKRCGIKPNLKRVLLIGPHLADYPSLFFKSVWNVIHSEGMKEKIAHHAGHPYVPANSQKTMDWFKDTPFSEDIRNISLKARRPGYPVRVEARYFRFDTLSRNGRKRLHWFFDCPKPKKPISGLHRGLFRVPESSQVICDFCEENSNALSQRKS